MCLSLENKTKGPARLYTHMMMLLLLDKIVIKRLHSSLQIAVAIFPRKPRRILAKADGLKKIPNVSYCVPDGRHVKTTVEGENNP